MDLGSTNTIGVSRPVVRPAAAKPERVAREQPSPTPAPYYSILFRSAADRAAAERRDAPDCFPDLNLDQIVDAITAGRDEYDLKPFFYGALNNVAAVEYRQAVFGDLERGKLRAHIAAFAQRMRMMRDQRTQAAKLHYHYQKQGWLVTAIESYCDAVTKLSDDLAVATPASDGLRGFGQKLGDYITDPRFRSLRDDTAALRVRLNAIRYAIQIHDASFTVRRYTDEPDYSREVEDTFAKFKQGTVDSYALNFSDPLQMNHIEGKILDFVAELFPEEFTALDEHCRKYGDFVEHSIAAFDREIQFYLAYLDYTVPLLAAGLRLCHPAVSATDKAIGYDDAYDLALAQKLVAANATVVTNDFAISGIERIVVVSGPNQGGKTTFARTFGQMHHLACLGCPVPGSAARLFLFDRLFTHFEKQEDIHNLRGKLEDDLVRVRSILDHATGDSVIVMNEIFTSTTLSDAIFLGTEILNRVTRLGALSVCVTFVDELASLNETVVSMASTIIPGNPAERTFKVVRRPADGIAHAISIAEKYRITHQCVKERIQS